MNAQEAVFNTMQNKHQFVSRVNDSDKVIVFERGPLVFVFNFHPNKSFEHY